MSDEYGPWITHDGLGLPVPVGTLVKVVYANGTTQEWRAGMGRISIFGDPVSGPRTEYRPERCVWSWALPGSCVPPRLRVVRYRVRKPRGLVICEALLADLPERVDA